MKEWIMSSLDSQYTTLIPILSDELNISEPFARLLLFRFLKANPFFTLSHSHKELLEELAFFLNPRLKFLSQPETIPNIQKAADIILEAIEENQQILIWGDYDADGITATSLCIEIFNFHGIKAKWHIPERTSESYGLNIPKIQTCIEEGIKLIITVDCGISDHAAVEYANTHGLKIIITDHHTLPPTLPDAHAICNPHMLQNNSMPLAGVGVAFFLMCQLNKKLEPISKKKYDMRQVLDLVAIGTIADMVPLQGQNRILAKNGLLKISEAHRQGIQELKVICGYSRSGAINSSHVSFGLAPRINAAGRIGNPEIAVKLFLTQERDEAEHLAQQLNSWNKERKAQEESIILQAEENALEYQHHKALVLTNLSWNQGIIGIVAAKIVEKFQKPTCILTADFHEENTYKGSGRSTNSINLYEALFSCKEFLTSFGGHAKAAGLKISSQNLQNFRIAFNNYVTINDNSSSPSLPIECQLDFQQASSFSFLKELEMLEPYGSENPEPIFASPILHIKKLTWFGIGKKHLALDLLDTSTGITLQVKLWNTNNIPYKQNDTIKIAYQPELDYYSGLAKIQIRIIDYAI